jgi:asparagine synthase (glutamine-hydrolysing)
MLMANSVEGRFPFLDRDVVDFANTLPARHKLFGLEEKYLLKRAFADLVPDDIIHRPKQPYRAPDATSFFTPDRPAWFDEVMAERAIAAAGVFEPSLVAGLLAKCRRTGGENMSNTDNMRVLAVVSTQLTHECFIAGGLGERESSLPDPSVAVDLVADDRSVP